MPSRRAFLAALATTAGCTTEAPGTPTKTTERSSTTTTDSGSTTTTTQTTETTQTTTESTPSSVEPADGMAWGFEPPGVAGQVAATDSLAFVADDQGNLYGVELASGELVWSQSFEHPVGTHRAFDDTLVTTEDGALYAFTGKMYLHGQAFEIHRLDPVSGDIRWTQSPGIDNHHLYSIDVTADALLVGSQNDMLGDWSDPALCIDTKSGSRRWQTGGGDADSGVLGGQRAYVGSYAGVTAIDRQRGTRTWRREIPDPTPIYLGASDVFVGSKEYEQSKAMALDPENGETRWTFDEWIVTSLNYDQTRDAPFVGGEKLARLGADGTPRWTADAGGLIAETPIADGVLYGLTDSEVFGIDVESGARSFSYEPGWKFPRPVTVANDIVLVEAGRSARLGGVRTDGTESWTAEFSSDGVTALATGSEHVAATAGGVLYGRPLSGR